MKRKISLILTLALACGMLSCLCSCQTFDKNDYSFFEPDNTGVWEGEGITLYKLPEGGNYGIMDLDGQKTIVSFEKRWMVLGYSVFIEVYDDMDFFDFRSTFGANSRNSSLIAPKRVFELQFGRKGEDIYFKITGCLRESYKSCLGKEYRAKKTADVVPEVSYWQNLPQAVGTWEGKYEILDRDDAGNFYYLLHTYEMRVTSDGTPEGVEISLKIDGQPVDVVCIKEYNALGEFIGLTMLPTYKYEELSERGFEFEKARVAEYYPENMETCNEYSGYSLTYLFENMLSTRYYLNISRVGSPDSDLGSFGNITRLKKIA